MFLAEANFSQKHGQNPPNSALGLDPTTRSPPNFWKIFAGCADPGLQQELRCQFKIIIQIRKPIAYSNDIGIQNNGVLKLNPFGGSSLQPFGRPDAKGFSIYLDVVTSIHGQRWMKEQFRNRRC